MILNCALNIMIMILLSSCAQIKLEDVPIIKPLKIGDKVVCYYEVRFVSGRDRCVPVDEYLTRIEPTSIVLPYESFLFFKKISLKACALADQSSKASCVQDVNNVDYWLNEMIKLSR